MTKNNSWINLKNITALTLGVILIYVIVNALVNIRFKELELSARARIADQEKLLVTIAETTTRNGADKVTEAIVIDCSIEDRNQFDSLLDQLNKNLSKPQLVELERLFGRCGGFYSERKSVMVARLSREIEIFVNYVNQLSEISREDQSEKFKVSQWQSLATEEKTQSDEFFRLVNLQDRIIKTLLAGNAADSTQISDILNEVTQVQQNLADAKSKATTIRNELFPL